MILHAPAVLAAAASSDTATGVGIPLALAAGLVSFLSPCVLPLVPGYLSTVIGVAPADLKTAGMRRVLVPSLLFIASFSAIFILLGLSATVIGSSLNRHKHTLELIGGAVIVAMGVIFCAAPFVGALAREWHPRRLLALVGRGGPLIAGAAFAIAWIMRKHDLAQVAPSTVQEREQAEVLGRLQALRLLLDAHGQALVQRRTPADRVPLLLVLARDVERPAGHPNGAAVTRGVGFVRRLGLCFARAIGDLDVSHELLASLSVLHTPLLRARSRPRALHNRDTCRSWRSPGPAPRHGPAGPCARHAPRPQPSSSPPRSSRAVGAYCIRPPGPGSARTR